MFFCEFGKISKNIFWQSTSGWPLLKFICEFWEVFQNISFIEHLWETAYFMYKLQYFNQQIQWRTISQVLIQALYTRPREVAIRRRSFTWNPLKLSVKRLICNEVAGCQQASLRKKVSRIFFHVFCLHSLRTHHDYFFRRGSETVQAKFLSGNISKKWYYL